jgi:DNA-binding transcriptional LysR family regulator
MELRQLRYFIAVAEEGGFRRAAARLFMAQPPLSQQIAALERELGVQLFDRTARGSELTVAAHALLPHARRAIAAADATVAASKSLRDGTEGTLRLSFVSSASLSVVPRILSHYGERWPLVGFDLHELPNDQQIERIRNGHLDAGVVRAKTGHEELESLWLMDEPLVAAVPRHHALASQSKAWLADLRNDSFIGVDRTQSPHLFHDLAVMCEVAGFHYEPRRWGNQYTTILGLVEAGLGVAIVPQSLKALKLPNLAYVPLAEDFTVSPLYLVRSLDGDHRLSTLLFEAAASLVDEAGGFGSPSARPEP